MDVFVFGYPGSLGGADTELWHVLRLWRKFGLDVGVIPTWKANSEWRRKCDDLGLSTFQIEGPHEFEKVPKLAGATVVSFCNGMFLKEAKFFRQLGCRLVWVNCMTWMFAAERRFYSEHGPFDAYVFQSEFQKSQLLPELKQFGVSDRQCFHVPGAFDPDEFPFRPRRHGRDEVFTVGRLARPDVDKWSEETWEIYGAIPFSPVHARIMGWAPRIARKIGGPPPWAEVLRPCEETPLEFYASLHCLMAANGGARENWPRVGLEAMASGVPLVVDNAWGWLEMVEHGRTGYLASDANEFAYYGAHLAMNEEFRWAMAREARLQLTDELANPLRIWNAWERLFAAMDRVGSDQDLAEENGKGKLKLPPCECEASCDSIRNQCGR